MIKKYPGVTITTGAQWSDDLTGATPDQWPEIVEQYHWYCRHVLPNDCRNLLRMVKEGEATDWAGYDDREIYLRDGLGLDPKAVDWALAGLRVMGAESAVAFKEAQKLGRHGGDRRSEQAKVDQGSDRTLKSRGETAAYLTARLRKEGFDELAAAVVTGKMSARAAAREAGIIIPPTPLTIIRRAWKRMSPADRATFLKEVAP